MHLYINANNHTRSNELNFPLKYLEMNDQPLINVFCASGKENSSFWKKGYNPRKNNSTNVCRTPKSNGNVKIDII